MTGETEAERDQKARWGSGKERIRAGVKQNKLKNARKWRLKARSRMTRGLVRKDRMSENSTNENPQLELEGPATTYSTGALRDFWMRLRWS